MMRYLLMAFACSAAALGASGCFEPVEQLVGGRDAGHASRRDGGLRPDASLFPPDGSLVVPDAGTTGDAGDVFCSGDTARIRVGSTESPLATTGSLRFMDCCEALDLTLHTKGELGDLASLGLVAFGAVAFPTGEVTIALDPNQPIMATLTIGASYYGSGMTAAANQFFGTIAFTHDDYQSPTDLRLCLTIDAPGDEHDGVRFYAPAARVMAYSWQRRFAFYLLADDALDASAASSLPLSSLVLAQEPLLDLYSIDYYRQSDHFVALGDMTPEALKNRIGAIPLGGRPFVVVADDARIYLGAFWTPVSSFMPLVPIVVMDTTTMQRGFTIEPPATGTADLRGDPRITATLRDSGKLAP